MTVDVGAVVASVKGGAQQPQLLWVTAAAPVFYRLTLLAVSLGWGSTTNRKDL